MQDPYLYQIEPSQGADAAIVFITGFHTKKRSHHQPWITSLRAAGWHGAIYHFWWDSGMQKVFYQEAENWRRHKRRARCAGELYLEKMVVYKVKESLVSLIGHSLGARVAFFGMRGWYAQSSHTLKDVYLLGGAVPTEREWRLAISKINGSLFNFYNSNDPTLSTWYRAIEMGLHPCGLRPVFPGHASVDNVDVTGLVGRTHALNKYLKALPRLDGTVQSFVQGF